MITIYSLRVGRKRYVGASSVYDQRKRHHTYLLSARRHYNSDLQEAFSREKKCSFEILEVCSKRIGPTREKWWIKKLKTDDPVFGFNICYPISGGSVSSRASALRKSEMTLERRRAISSQRRASLRDPKTVAKTMRGLKRAQRDPEFWKRHSRKLKTYYRDPKNRENLSVRLQDAWKDPEKLRLLVESRNTPEYKEAQSRRMKEVWRKRKLKEKT